MGEEPNVDIHFNLKENTLAPKPVWEESLGGYQVLKKWLSYRETAVLGRALHADEARMFTQIARRIVAIILMESQLDENYLRCAAQTWDWNAAVAQASQPRFWTDD